jgi:hypothetical protein
VPAPTWSGAHQIAEAVTSAGFEPNFHPTGTSNHNASTVVAHERCARAIVLAESWLGKSIFVPRDLLAVLPAVALLVAVTLLGLGLPQWIAWGALVLVIALRALQLAPSYGVSPENWKAATEHLMANAQSRDCVGFYPSDGRMAFRYYAAHGPRPILPSAPWSENGVYIEQYRTMAPATVQGLPSTCPGLWLVSSHEGQATGPAAARRNRARYQTLVAELRRAYGPPSVAAFGYAAVVRVQLFTVEASAR